MEQNTLQPQPPVIAPILTPASSHAPRMGPWIFGAIVVVSIAVIAWLVLTRVASSPSAEIPKGGATIVASASAREVAIGQQFTVDIIIDSGQLSISAVDLVVAYSAPIVRVVSIRKGALLPVELVGGVFQNGEATITVASGTAPMKGNGSIATITFEAIAPGAAVITPMSSTQIAAIGQAKNVAGSMTPTVVTIR